MRELVFTAITTDDQLRIAGGFATLADLAAATFGSNSVDTPPMRPFIILHWGTTPDRMKDSGTYRRDLNVWVHDEGGDYGRIDAMLARIRAILDALAGTTGGGKYISGIDWSGDSDDLEDTGYQTVTRNSSYQVIGNGA